MALLVLPCPPATESDLDAWLKEPALNTEIGRLVFEGPRTTRPIILAYSFLAQLISIHLESLRCSAAGLDLCRLSLAHVDRSAQFCLADQ